MSFKYKVPLKVYTASSTRPYLQRLAHQLFAKIQNRMIIPAIEAFPLGQVTEAHNRIESRQTMGAVVLTPGG